MRSQFLTIGTTGLFPVPGVIWLEPYLDRMTLSRQSDSPLPDIDCSSQFFNHVVSNNYVERSPVHDEKI